MVSIKIHFFGSTNLMENFIWGRKAIKLDYRSICTPNSLFHKVAEYFKKARSQKMLGLFNKLLI